MNKTEQKEEAKAVAEQKEEAKAVAEQIEEAKAVAEQIVKEAEKESSKIIKEAEKKIKEMIEGLPDTSAPQVVIEAPKEEKVSLPDYLKEMQKAEEKKVNISLFKDSEKYKDDLFVAVNGKKRFQIKRGENVEVPAYIALVEKASENQDRRTTELMISKQEESEARLKMF